MCKGLKVCENCKKPQCVGKYVPAPTADGLSLNCANCRAGLEIKDYSCVCYPKASSEKVCDCCGTINKLLEFGKSLITPDKLTSYCQRCRHSGTSC